jgi:RHS repeat-associated protein
VSETAALCDNPVTVTRRGGQTAVEYAQPATFANGWSTPAAARTTTVTVRIVLLSVRSGRGATGVVHAADHGDERDAVAAVECGVEPFLLCGEACGERTGTGSYTSVGAPDRLGSEMSYFPYGDEKGTVTAQVRVKFATYWRDGESGLDYAVNRYYSSAMGRFLSADPAVSGAGLGEPQAWNRYGYVGGDPVNRSDPAGTCWATVTAGGTSVSQYYDCIDPTVAMVYGLAGGMLGTGMNSSAAELTFQAWNAAAGFSMQIMSEAVMAIGDLGTHCKSVLPTNALGSLATNVTFYDARNTQVAGSPAFSLTGNGNYGTETLGSLLQMAAADALVLQGPGNAILKKVVLAPAFFNEPSAGHTLQQSQETTLVHELLHIQYGKGDVDLADALFGFGKTPPAGVTNQQWHDAASAAISEWLFVDCPSPGKK